MPEQITIPFQSHWLHKMLVGLKTCTSRTKKYGNTGDTFEQFGTTFRILSVDRYILKHVADILYMEEGCDKPEEFRKIWMKLHPGKGFVPTQTVWVHFFRKET